MDEAREVIREIAAQIVTGQIAPVEGARQIADEAGRLDSPAYFTTFGELARDGAEEAIVEQASLLLADTA